MSQGHGPSVVPLYLLYVHLSMDTLSSFRFAFMLIQSVMLCAAPSQIRFGLVWLPAGHEYYSKVKSACISSCHSSVLPFQ